MKKILCLIAISLATLPAALQAQTIYDAVNFTNKDLNGTARFVGMGGAMSALGANISTISSNPAGIALYRSNEVMTSFGVNAYSVDSKYMNSTTKLNKTKWSFDNLGFVYSSYLGNNSKLKFINFGFNYSRSKSFDKYMSMEGLLNLAPNGAPISQTDQMANQANRMYETYGKEGDIRTIADEGVRNMFDDSNIGWLAAMGWEGYLYSPTDRIGEYNAYLPQAQSWFNSREKGGIDQYDFNISFNISDRWYIGLTVGAYDVDYTKVSSYGEDYGDFVEEGHNYGNQSYELSTEKKIYGAGVDFKLGTIVRPFENSPFRIGVAISTPTFYDLTVKTNGRGVTQLFRNDPKLGKGIVKEIIDTYDYTRNVDYGYDFRIRTPWKYNFSLGYTIGRSIALGAEYEYQDYSCMDFSYSGGYDMYYENSTADQMLKGVHTLRVGAEFKITPEIAARCGYNYISQAYNNSAYKDLPPNSINLDTDYSNSKAQNNYTLGLGYQGRTFYADVAYQLNKYKADFYAFENVDLNKTEVKYNSNKVLVTLGMRF